MKLIDCSHLAGPCPKCKRVGLPLLPLGPKGRAACIECVMADGQKSFARLKILIGGQYAAAFIWPEGGRLEHNRIIAFDLRDPGHWPNNCASCVALALFEEQQARLKKVKQTLIGWKEQRERETEMQKGDEHAFTA